jgi:hypothetical protein
MGIFLFKTPTSCKWKIVLCKVTSVGLFSKDKWKVDKILDLSSSWAFMNIITSDTHYDNHHVGSHWGKNWHHRIPFKKLIPKQGNGGYLHIVFMFRGLRSFNWGHSPPSSLFPKLDLNSWPFPLKGKVLATRSWIGL